jgi:hypothetical protein
LWAKLQEATHEITDLRGDFQREREELMNNIRELTVQVKLKASIIQHFIPVEEVNKIEHRALWDEDTQNWALATAGQKTEDP